MLCWLMERFLAANMSDDACEMFKTNNEIMAPSAGGLANLENGKLGGEKIPVGGELDHFKGLS